MRPRLVGTGSDEVMGCRGFVAARADEGTGHGSFVRARSADGKVRASVAGLGAVMSGYRYGKRLARRGAASALPVVWASSTFLHGWR